MTMKRMSDVEISSATVQESSIADPVERARAIMTRLGLFPQTRDELIAKFGADRCWWICQTYGDKFSPAMLVRMIRDRQ